MKRPGDARDGREVKAIRTVRMTQSVTAGSGFEDEEREPSPKECTQILEAGDSQLIAGKEIGPQSCNCLELNFANNLNEIGSGFIPGPPDKTRPASTSILACEAGQKSLGNQLSLTAQTSALEVCEILNVIVRC